MPAGRTPPKFLLARIKFPMSEDIDWIALSGRRAKGKRPEFFDDPAIERLYSVVLALIGEVSVVRERLDTVERLLETNAYLDRNEIEVYKPDLEAGVERGTLTQAYISRVMRGFQQEVEALEADDTPVADWIRKLAKE